MHAAKENRYDGWHGWRNVVFVGPSYVIDRTGHSRAREIPFLRQKVNYFCAFSKIDRHYLLGCPSTTKVFFRRGFLSLGETRAIPGPMPINLNLK